MDKEAAKAVAGLWAKNTDRLGYKLVGALGRIFGSLAAKDEEVYTYGIRSAAGGDGFVNLAAAIGNRQVATIEITQEADFVASRILHVALNPATGAILPYQVAGGPSYIVQMTDGGSDRTLQNFQLHVDTIAGTAQRSVPFPKNRLFRRNSTISFVYTNQQAVATQVWMAILGYKIYDEASLDLVRRR